jgi:hypothetical protein
MVTVTVTYGNIHPLYPTLGLIGLSAAPCVQPEGLTGGSGRSKGKRRGERRAEERGGQAFSCSSVTQTFLLSESCGNSSSRMSISSIFRGSLPQVSQYIRFQEECQLHVLINSA